VLKQRGLRGKSVLYAYGRGVVAFKTVASGSWRVTGA
jgi:hypothetical protein